MEADKSQQPVGSNQPHMHNPTVPSSNDSEAQSLEEKPVPKQAPGPPAHNWLGEIPDGGTQAWIQVVCGWILFFNTWGILNTFGVFQTYYETGQLFVESSSTISWIGSIQSLCVLLVGLFSGPFYDAGHLRFLLISGSFMVVFGFMMLSLCKEFWQCLLAQGFCTGIGGGLLFVPAVAILPTYFKRKLGLAVGLAASGSSMGGIIYPIVFYRLISRIGFGWSTRVIGFIALGTLLIPVFFMRMRVKPPAKRSLFDATFFTDVPILLFTLCTFLGFIALYVALFYISFFAGSTRITDQSLSFYLVPILNAGSVFGRTVPNAISDITGPINLMAPGALIVSILIFCLIAVHNVGGIVVVTLLFGFFSGIFIALPPVVVVVLTEDKRKIGTRIGMVFAILGGAVLCGGPGGGGILGNGRTDLNFTGLWIYGGVTALASGFGLYYLRFLRGGLKLKAKV